MHGAVKIVDKEGIDANVFTGTEDQVMVRANSDTTIFTVSYEPNTNSNFLNSLGVVLQIQKSNQPEIIGENLFAFEPESSTQILSFGYMNTLDEVKHGLSFKKLMYGISKKEVTFDVKGNDVNNQDVTINTTIVNLEAIYV